MIQGGDSGGDCCYSRGDLGNFVTEGDSCIVGDWEDEWNGRRTPYILGKSVKIVTLFGTNTGHLQGQKQRETGSRDHVVSMTSLISWTLVRP